jgi:hypothetical protein
MEVRRLLKNVDTYLQDFTAVYTKETVCFLISGVGLLVLWPLTGLLYQPRMIGDGDCGEIGGLKLGRGN